MIPSRGASNLSWKGQTDYGYLQHSSVFPEYTQELVLVDTDGRRNNNEECVIPEFILPSGSRLRFWLLRSSCCERKRPDRDPIDAMNVFTGAVPPELGKILTLEYLELQGNQLSGEYHVEIYSYTQ